MDREASRVGVIGPEEDVEWHMREALAPVLFDEDDYEEAARERGSIVAPAKPSPSAAAHLVKPVAQKELAVQVAIAADPDGQMQDAGELAK